jgi:hypothetical protein
VFIRMCTTDALECLCTSSVTTSASPIQED